MLLNPSTTMSGTPGRKQMITTYRNRRRIAILVISASALTLGACTSSLVLGTAYNEAAKRTADRVKSFADFDSEQRQEIDQSFQSFLQWHRVSELPAYSAILNNVATTLQSDQSISEIQIDQWFDTIEQRGQRARECSPLGGASGFLTEMAGWQIQQLGNKLRTNRSEQYERFSKTSAEDRRKRRREWMISWSSRAGIKMNDTQKLLLDNTLAQQTSMGERRFKLWTDWTEQFISLLNDRESEQFPGLVQSHIDSLWNLTERNYPQEWNQNRELWQGFAHEFLNGLSVDQKNALVNNIVSISKTVTTLSKKRSRRAKPVCFRESL